MELKNRTVKEKNGKGRKTKGPKFSHWEWESIAESFLKSAERGDTKEVERVLDMGLDPNHKSNCGATALILAVSNGHLDTCEVLINRGANVSAGNLCYFSAVALAVEKGNKEIIQLLIENGANVNEKYYRFSLLQIAADNGDYDICKLLLDLGARVNAESKKEASPLRSAVLGGNNNIVKLFIERGADVNAQDKYGATAVRIAEWMGETEICNTLVSAGADTAIKDKFDDGEKERFKLFLKMVKNNRRYKYACKEGEEFYFKMRDGTIVGKAKSINEFKAMIGTLPEESIAYHLENGHFAPWLEFIDEKDRAEAVKKIKKYDDAKARMLRAMECNSCFWVLPLFGI